MLGVWSMKVGVGCVATEGRFDECGLRGLFSRK